MAAGDGSIVPVFAAVQERKYVHPTQRNARFLNVDVTNSLATLTEKRMETTSDSQGNTGEHVVSNGQASLSHANSNASKDPTELSLAPCTHAEPVRMVIGPPPTFAT